MKAESRKRGLVSMNDEEKYEYWEDIAQYDLSSAKAMLHSGRYLYVVFMCQQALEKLVKGLYVLYTGTEPPRTHNIWLVFSRVFEKDIYKNKITDPMFEQKIEKYRPFFAELIAYYLSERYPSYRQKLSTSIQADKAKRVMQRTEEVFTWLKSLKRFTK